MVLTPVLMYFVLWQPAHSAVRKLHASVPVMYMEAERLRNHASEVEMLRHRPKPAVLDAVALKSTIEDSALRHNLREAISTLICRSPMQCGYHLQRCPLSNGCAGCGPCSKSSTSVPTL